MLGVAGVITPIDKPVSPIISEYLSDALKLIGRDSLDIDVLFVGAYDTEHVRWKENGWEEAKSKAERVRAEIDAHLDGVVAQEAAKRAAAENGENWEGGESLAPFDEFWSDLLDAHSEFYDTPSPAKGKGAAALSLYNKGRFELQVRNDVARSIDESNFTKILTGRSIADRVALDMEVGEIGGPFRGPLGLLHRVPPKTLGPTAANGPASAQDPRPRPRRVPARQLRQVRARGVAHGGDVGRARGLTVR